MKTLGDLKKFVERLPEQVIFDGSLSEPFSWRGSYNEVCFRIEESECNKDYLMSVIDMALTKEFEGYKGGLFSYNEDTPINFEVDESQYSDGAYANIMLLRLLLKSHDR